MVTVKNTAFNSLCKYTTNKVYKYLTKSLSSVCYSHLLWDFVDVFLGEYNKNNDRQHNSL